MSMETIGLTMIWAGVGTLFAIAMTKVRQRRLDAQAQRFLRGGYNARLDLRTTAGDWLAVIGALATDWLLLCVFLAATWLVVRWMLHVI